VPPSELGRDNVAKDALVKACGYGARNGCGVFNRGHIRRNNAIARTAEKPVEPVFQGFAKRLPEPIVPDLLLVFDQHHCAAVKKAYEGCCPFLNPVAT